eukprot:1973475-Rhodomonas_salina.1
MVPAIVLPRHHRLRAPSAHRRPSGTESGPELRRPDAQPRLAQPRLLVFPNRAINGGIKGRVSVKRVVKR